MTKARTLADNYAADINQVTADAPLTGGGTSGTVTVGIQAGTTAQSGAVQLTDSTASTSTTTAATPNSVKSAYDLADAAIAKSIVDAKADLITATADNTPARLAVGANGDTLVADSSTSTGLRWNTQPVLANPILNSAMDIWQRGTSINYTSGTATYMADRYNLVNSQGTGSPNFTISRQTTGDTTNLPNIQYCMRIQRASGNTATTFPYMSQNLESANSIPFAGRTVTISYYARAGANYSASSSAFTLYLYSGTGTDQNINVTGLTGSATVATSNATLTTTWQRFTATGTVAASATQLAVQFFWSPTGTAGANDFMEITGLQIDVGSVALPFRRNAGTLAGELAACKYYFKRMTVANGIFGYALGMAQSGTSSMNIFNGVMRTTPTSTINGTLRLIQGNSDYAVTGINNTYYSSLNDAVNVNFTLASGLTAGYANCLYAATSGVSFDLSAEL